MQKGFTLVEVLITIAIFVLIFVAIFSIYLTGSGFYRKGETQAELLQNGRVILERVSREIRQAREIVTELSESESEGVSSILFEDGHATTTYQYIHYWQDGNLVKREVIGYYFSGDSTQTLVPWDSTPPSGQTLEEKTLVGPQIIGEYVFLLKIWGPRVVSISLILEDRGERVNLKTKVFGRNF